MSESKSARGQRGPREERGVAAERVLQAARSLFTTRGFASTSLRSVADLADVDVSLVSYYFTNKRGLLEAALTLPPNFASGVQASANAPIDERGRALVTANLAAWDDTSTADILRASILAAANEPSAMELLRTVYSSRIVDVVASHLPEDERQVRAGLVASQILGLAMTRYVWKIGALKDLPSDVVVRLIAPTIQHYLTGSLEELDS
jgi:AcrR family transcriptional regulator